MSKKKTPSRSHNSLATRRSTSTFDEKPWNNIFQVPERLRKLKVRFDHGNVNALHDALVLVRSSGCSVPGWVLKGAQEIVAIWLNTKTTTGKGRLGNEQAKHQQAMKDFRRWQAVKAVRSEGGTSWVDTWAVAARRLRGTSAAARGDAVRFSYRRVNKNLKSRADRSERMIEAVV